MSTALRTKLLLVPPLLLLLLLLPRPSVPLLHVDPAAVIIHSSSTLRTSTEAIFSCLEIQPDNSTRRPHSTVIWFKDGHVLDLSSKKYRNYGMKKRLLIRDPSENDTGVYECAFSQDSVDRGRAEIWIQPHVTYAPSPQAILAAANQTIVCQGGGGVQGVEWRKGGEVVSQSLTKQTSWSSDSRFTTLADGSLHLSQASYEDGGIYQCSVFNPAGKESVDIVVTVNDPVTATPPTEAPPISPIPSVDPIDLTPTPSPEAMDNCEELMDISFLPSTPTLPPTPSTERPTQLDPRLPPLSWNYTVPTFTTTLPECVRTTAGNSISIRCSAEGNPPPQILWKKGAGIIGVRGDSQDGALPHYQALDDGSLRINTVQKSDRAQYTCFAKNEVSTVAQLVRLKVTLVEEVCGVSHTPSSSPPRVRRIVGGEQVNSTTEFPWQVLIEYDDLLQPGTERLCGGALVRPDWVVTAAHCLYSHSNLIDPSHLRLRVGVANRSREEPSQQVLEVSHVFSHPNYTHLEYDIALLKLRHPARLTENVGLICLPPRSHDPPIGTMCKIAGWGHLQHGDSSSPDMLHKASVPTVSYSKCRSQKSYGNKITRNMLCAGYEEGGEDSCQNDSGGPLVCETGGRWTLHGVVNYGERCGAPHKYGLYARVIKFLKWMNPLMENF